MLRLLAHLVNSPLTSLCWCHAVLCLQVSHTEPDHSYLVPAVLDLYPEATVVASKVALNFLSGLTNRCGGRIRGKMMRSVMVE
jgi:flavorubredoxin